MDYIWFGRGASRWEPRPVAVLAPPPLQSLHCGLPNAQWPSDHVSLVADFELAPAALGCDGSGGDGDSDGHNSSRLQRGSKQSQQQQL